jgi:hypothetical protein
VDEEVTEEIHIPPGFTTSGLGRVDYPWELDPSHQLRDIGFTEHRFFCLELLAPG